MRVVKKTGLVPVHTAKDKTVVGVQPAVAIKGVADGTLYLFPIPEDVDTYEIDTDVKAKEPETVVEDDVSDIPEDWEKLHFMKIIIMAKKIHGGELPVVEDKKPAEVAKDIVREELARRVADAENPQGTAE